MPIDKAYGALIYACNEYMTLLFFFFFGLEPFLFHFDLCPYGLDGYPGMVKGSPLGLLLLLFLLLSVFYCAGNIHFWDTSSGKPGLSTVSGLFFKKNSGTRYGHFTIAKEV
ncbi:hypothetical protein V8C35DRAFT_167660 [Trichoderma chlorosporum]